jgi:Rieske Fe-S protein
MSCGCKDKDTKTRRDFITDLAGGLATLGVAGSLAKSTFASGGNQRNVLATVKIDDHQELKNPGGFILLKKTPAGDLLVTRSGEAEFSALSVVCPHMQCNIKVKSPTLIQCPCHQSGYKIDGSYISGPAKSGLRRFPVAIEAGVITILEG